MDVDLIVMATHAWGGIARCTYVRKLTRGTEKYDAGWCWLILHWAKGQAEPWYLLSDQPGTAALLRLYRIRMWTEEMVGDLKGHGFDLEATHLDDEDRIARLVLDLCSASA